MIKSSFSHILFALLLFSLPLMASERVNLKGMVTARETGRQLAGANVYLKGTIIGTSTDADGYFRLHDIPAGRYTLVASYVGYSVYEQTVDLQRDTTINIILSQQVISGPLVSVVATRARERVSPVTFSDVDKQELMLTYTTQDVPEVLSELPSTMFYSESGSGLGYNYISIRGFGQRRISVMVNGVPQNDPEDHNIYWVDFPDLLANVQSIQVQRGAGNAFYGPAAIGGSINILTNYFSPQRQFKASFGYGSFNTKKLSASYNTGLINKRFVLFGRFSNIKTDGYRERSWINFWSYFLGAAYYGDNQNLRIHFYGGPIEDGLVYTGLPKFVNQNETLRRKNFSYWKVNDSGDSLAYFTNRRKDEIENFNQPHLEILHELKLNDRVTLNNTAFYIRGYGFFDYDGSWGTPEYFRLTPEYGYHVSEIPSDALVRAYVDNNQVGWLPQITWRDRGEEMVFGAELRFHCSLHWGRLQKGSGLPADVVGDNGRHYYEYKGQKAIAALYFHQNYRIHHNLILTGDLQFSYKQYRFFDEKYLGNDFTVSYRFLNPHLGLNYNLNATSNVYFSVTRTTREPRLKNYYDAAEASTPADWGRVTPQFELNPDGSYNFKKPLVHPETLNGLELGYSFRGEKLRASANLFYMDFINEIIKKGGVDRFGQPITGNAERTLHQGLELAANWQMLPQVELSGNFMYSKNILKSYTVYKYDWDAGKSVPIVLDGNPIAGFPNVMGNLKLTYFWHGAYLGLAAKYVGKMYTDNFKNERNTVDPYTVLNLTFRYELKNLGIEGFSLKGKVNNLLNKKYLAFGEGDEFFPAATRNYFIALEYAF